MITADVGGGMHRSLQAVTDPAMQGKGLDTHSWGSQRRSLHVPGDHSEMHGNVLRLNDLDEWLNNLRRRPDDGFIRKVGSSLIDRPCIGDIIFMSDALAKIVSTGTIFDRLFRAIEQTMLKRPSDNI